jgi:septation ring formation regulator EzrA
MLHPIVGLMIEKYLNDSITDPARLAKIETLSSLNLIPPRIYSELRKQDSMRHIKDSLYLVAKGYIKNIRDTMGLDDEDEREALEKIKKDKDSVKKELPKKDSRSIPAKDQDRRDTSGGQKKSSSNGYSKKIININNVSKKSRHRKRG